MKRLFLSLGTLALLGLSSCIEKIDVNPNYNPDTKEVNANFIFNIATSENASTKQTGEIVQSSVTTSDDFRGIDHGKIIAMTVNNSLKTADGTESVTGGTNGSLVKVFDLYEIVSGGSLTGTGTPSSSQSKSRRVLELSIPTGVNNFLFYGKAIRGSDATDDSNGKIVFNVNNSSLDETTFELQPRLTEETKFNHTSALIAAVLTNILNNPTITVGDQTKHWKDFSNFNGQAGQGLKYSTPANISPLGEIVSKTFCNFVNIPSGSVRAGAGRSVLRMVGDMAVAIGKAAKATPTDPDEQQAALIAREIIKEMDKYFFITTPVSTVSEIPENYDENTFNALLRAETVEGQTVMVYDYSLVNTDADQVRWRSADDITDVITGSYDDVTTDFIRYFPTSFNMPAGVAQLTINESSLNVSFVDDPNTFSTAHSGIDRLKIMYPAELCYFGNSPIRVSDVVKDAKDYPDGSGHETNEWLNANSWSGWGPRGGEVLSTTRSIAMVDNINYGTALLKTSVGYYGIKAASPLVDNSGKSTSGNGDGNFYPDEDPKINYSSVPANLFYLTGILVGGQYKTMGWNYIMKNEEGNTNTNAYVVYDKIANPFTDVLSEKAIGIPATTSSDSYNASTSNYTMLWDNYNGNDAVQDQVLVALEFVNNSGTDFWGEHNIIRKGGTFYLLGKLIIPDEDESSFKWPDELDDKDKYALPPYSSTGATIKRERVFVQDYMTVANFRIGPTSLRHAYLTVPDLRSSQLSLGLSVDLQWRTGRTYNYTLGE